MKKIRNYLVPILLTVFSPLYGQYNKVDFYTPEAASLMRFIDYPVSPITGIPDIKIPLHSLKTGNKQIDLALSFHMDSYLRVNELPGSVGAGWSFSSDYQITRTINGLDDFATSPFSGYYYNNLAKYDYKDGDYFLRSRNEMYRLQQGQLDNQPDKFYYNIPGKSGTFYFKKQRDSSLKALTVPYDGVQISYQPITKSFQLVDTDGTVYSFQSADRSSSNPNSGRITISWKCVQMKSSSNVELATFKYDTEYVHDYDMFNDRLEVYDDLRSSGTLGSQSDDYRLKCRDMIPKTYGFWQMIGPKAILYAGYNTTGYSLGSNNQFQLVTESDGHWVPPCVLGPELGPGSRSTVYQRLKMLTEISFANNSGKILYNYTNEHILSSIKIVYNGDTIKRIAFNQYAPELIAPASKTAKFSRRLNYVTINDEKYSFTYGSEHEGCVSADLWGYDGVYPEYSLLNTQIRIPWQNIIFSYGDPGLHPRSFFLDCEQVYPHDRADTMKINNQNISWLTPLEPYCRRGIYNPFLTINYPTGGRVVYEIEQNRFKFNEGALSCGGFRINKISYFDNLSSTTPIREKVYKYGSNEDGLGMIKRLPLNPDVDDRYSNSTYSVQFVQFYNQSGIPLHSARKRTYAPTAVNSLTFSNGAFVNYAEVAEYDKDMTISAGKTVYKTDLEYYGPEISGPFDYPYEKEEWYSGLTDSIIQYKYVNGKYDWIQKKKFFYNKNIDDTLIFRERVHLTTLPIAVDGWSMPSTSWSTFFEENAGFYDQMGGIETGVIQNRGTATIVKDSKGDTIRTEEINYFNSSKDYLPSKTEITNSNANTTTKRFVYPKDYALGSVGEGAFVDTLKSKNMIDVPIEIVELCNGKISSAVLNIFNTNATLAAVMKLKGTLQNQAQFKMSNKANIGDFSSTSSNSTFSKSDKYTESIVVNSYDDYGNPICVYDPNTMMTTCYIWCYAGKYPIAEIKNATQAEVETALCHRINNISNLYEYATSMRNQVNNIRNILTNAFVTTYTYKPLVGIQTTTDPRGVTTYYEYDSNSRLIEIYIIKNGLKNILKSYDYHFRQ